MRNRHALLVAPLAAPAMLSVYSLVGLIGDTSGDPLGYIENSLSMSLFVGGPVAYLIAFTVGYPTYWILKRIGRVSLRSLLLAGAVIGGVTFSLIGSLLVDQADPNLVMILIGGSMGLGVAATYWLLRDS